MLKKHKNKRGESLLETVIAFVILAMGITIAGMIIGSSLRNMQNAKNRIIAINIARGGIEAVRNIRDTNWLFFQSRRRACWNNIPPQDPEKICTGHTPIMPGSYLIYKQGGFPLLNSDPTYRWMLGEFKWDGLSEYDSNSVPECNIDDDYYFNTTENFTYRCNGSTWENIALLSLVDIDGMTDTDGDGDYDNDPDFYNHIYPGRNVDFPLGKYVKDSFFTRTIKIEYIKNDGTIISDPAEYSPDVNRMRVTSQVTWMSGRHRFKVELTTHLTDYLGRERLEG